jgi:hypothetical protein
VVVVGVAAAWGHRDSGELIAYSYVSYDRGFGL